MTFEPHNSFASVGRRIAIWYRGLERGGDEAALERAIAVIRSRRVSRAKAPATTVFRAAACVAFFVGGAATDRLLVRRQAAASDPYAIVFVFRAPSASQVSLIGDFNGWKDGATRLVRRGDGAWSTTLHLPPGIHAYAYIIDGATWAVDPLAPKSSTSDFGSPTSTVVVAREQGS